MPAHAAMVASTWKERVKFSYTLQSRWCSICLLHVEDMNVAVTTQLQSDEYTPLVHQLECIVIDTVSM